MCIIQFIISFIKTLLVADKRVELYGISIDDANISLHIQLSEYIPGIYVSDLVYRLYCDNPTQVQSDTQLGHWSYINDSIFWNCGEAHLCNI